MRGDGEKTKEPGDLRGYAGQPAAEQPKDPREQASVSLWLRDDAGCTPVEEALHNSEERFRTVAQTASDAIITIDSRGTISFWNKAAETIFGYRPDEAVGQSLAFIMPARFRTAHHNGMERLLATREPRLLGQTVEMVGLRRDGSEFPVELSLSTWKVKADVFFTGILRDITARVRAEEEIESLARFPGENRFPVLRVAQDGTILYANAASAPLLAVWATKVGHKLPDGLRERVADAIDCSESRTTEVSVGDRIFSLDVAPVPTAGYANLYGRDVTEQVRAERLLREQNQFIVNALEALNHPFYVIDAHDYTIKMANSATGQSEFPEPVTCYALTHRQSAPCETNGNPCPLEQIKRTGEPVIVEHVHYDSAGHSRYYEVHGHPIFDGDGNVTQIIEYTLDITQRKRMEDALREAHHGLELRVEERTAQLAQAVQVLEAETARHKHTAETLRESEERYRRLVELAFEAIMIHSDGKLVYINPAGAQLLGASHAEQLVGKPIEELVHPDYWGVVRSRVQRASKEGHGAPLVEEKLLRLDGSTVEVEMASIPITYHGQPALQTVIRDISERKRAEAEREIERTRIARDLHDSLGHSLGYLHLKLDQLAESNAALDVPQVRRELVRMRDVSNEAYDTVRGMLAALLPAGSADLATAMLVQAQVIGERGGFAVQVTTTGRSQRLAPVLQQQLLHLSQEALINVERHAHAQQVHIELRWAADALTMVMADDGCGFDVSASPAKGHYGLMFMHERAEEMRGALTITSLPGAGTRVVLRLPLAPHLQRVLDT